MVRTYDADDRDADLPLTQDEKAAEQEADRIRDARRPARRETLGRVRGRSGPHPIHPVPNADAGARAWGPDTAAMIAEAVGAGAKCAGGQSEGAGTAMEPGDTDDGYALLALGERLVQARALQAAAELRLGDLLADGPLTPTDLAAEAGCDPDALHRLLALLASDGIVARAGGDRFELTRAGAPLRSDHPASVRAVLELDGAVAPLVIGAVGHSLETGEPSFPQALGTDIYAYMDEHPDHGEVFDRAMDDLTRLVAPGLLAAYDFSEVRRVVDVGGGNGMLLAEILRAYPQVEGVLLEVPRVAGAAQEHLREQGLSERCRVVAGDFFAEVPEGGDVYLLKGVLHNWPEREALQILRSCRRAMSGTRGARLLAVESLLPDGDDAPHPARTTDLAMLVLSGGRERTRAEYAELMEAAGLQLEAVREADSRFAVLEGALTAPRPTTPA
ncbi:methyltransferase [Nocardiopsis salina]|uniref:methyltransferase n=1 Tax=Nocardiopsis salina TaxID=245836 RepID=UPI00034B6872|nr:methyltransferase [Nocardiopsis salina]